MDISVDRKKVSEELSVLMQKRKLWVESSRENDFEEGLKCLLSDLYPDNAHFIYELLQNAEDAHAKTVSFTLSQNDVIFEHDGNRLFNINDVESITSIGKTTKTDKNTAIGKFGVGFKAVFAYTDTPIIHSGDFHFRISDLVIPEPVEELSCDTKTRFIFPFNSSDKSSAKAIYEIEKGLRELGNETLLFLKYIHKIEYRFPDGKGRGYMERQDRNDGIVEIIVDIPNEDEQAFYWLRYEKRVDVVNEGKRDVYPIAMAFELEENVRKEQINRWNIIPANPGKVCIFFPAEKETSKLKFYIHAPFASTVARDSVRECKENESLRDKIAELVVESLNDIKKRGLLTVDFLAVLPNPYDKLSPFYEPIREMVVKAFQEHPLVPTKNGDYAPAKTLYHGITTISEVFDDSDLSSLIEHESPLWAKNASQRNSDEDRFIRSLAIQEFDYNNVLSLFIEKRNKIENLIDGKDNKWLKMLYSLLYASVNAPHTNVLIRNDFQQAIEFIKIIRTSSGLIGSRENVYILPQNVAMALSDVKIVKRETYEGSDAFSGNAERFLRNVLGIKDYSPNADVEIKIKHYSQKSFVESDSAYYQFILGLAKYYKSNPSINVKYAFLLCEANGTLYKRAPAQLALCKPYTDDGINHICKLIKKDPLAPNYYNHYNSEELQLFVGFLKDIGVTHKLTFIHCDAKRNPQFRDKLRSDRPVRNETNHDWTIPNIESILNLQNISVSQLVWDAIISYPISYYSNDIRYAKYSPNGSAAVKTCPSTLIYFLKHYDWIPDRSGNFHKPRDITKDELSKRFPYDDRNGLLSAIEFGLGSSIKTNEITKAIEKLGVEAGSVEAQIIDAITQNKCSESLLTDVLRTLRKVDPDNQDMLSPVDAFGSASIAQSGQVDESTCESSGIPDKARRQKKLEEEFEQGLINRKEINRVLNYSFNNATMDEKREMYHQYKGKCQICNKVIVKHNSKPHFQAINIIDTKILDRKFISTLSIGWNTLCLCPYCAAEYRYCSKDISTLPDQIKFVDIPEKSGKHIELTFIMCGEERRIKFTPKHLLSLQIALRLSEEQ